MVCSCKIVGSTSYKLQATIYKLLMGLVSELGFGFVVLRSDESVVESEPLISETAVESCRAEIRSSQGSATSKPESDVVESLLAPREGLVLEAEVIEALAEPGLVESRPELPELLLSQLLLGKRLLTELVESRLSKSRLSKSRLSKSRLS